MTVLHVHLKENDDFPVERRWLSASGEVELRITQDGTPIMEIWTITPERIVIRTVPAPDIGADEDTLPVLIDCACVGGVSEPPHKRTCPYYY